MSPTSAPPDAALFYANGLEEWAESGCDGSALRLLLVQPTYRPAAAHTVVDDETAVCPRAHELTVNRYARQPLAGWRFAMDAGGFCLETPEVVFGALEPGERVGGAVLFREMGSDRLSRLLAFYPLGRRGTTGGIWSITWGEGPGLATLFDWHPPSPEARRSHA